MHGQVDLAPIVFSRLYIRPTHSRDKAVSHYVTDNCSGLWRAYHVEAPFCGLSLAVGDRKFGSASSSARNIVEWSGHGLCDTLNWN